MMVEKYSCHNNRQSFSAGKIKRDNRRRKDNPPDDLPDDRGSARRLNPIAVVVVVVTGYGRLCPVTCSPADGAERRRETQRERDRQGGQAGEESDAAVEMIPFHHARPRRLLLFVMCVCVCVCVCRTGRMIVLIWHVVMDRHTDRMFFLSVFFPREIFYLLLTAGGDRKRWTCQL
jgi:hypothetical protein